ncbi:nucleoporin Nup145p [[Candida] anglica]
MFSSNPQKTDNSWGSATGFGKSSSFSGPSSDPKRTQSGGLFGSSATGSTAPSGGLFGSSTTGPTAPSGGLFGSSTNNTSSTFGNTNSTSNNTTIGSTSGGLFGNNTAPANSSNSTTGTSGGLFGNSNTTSNVGSGLFGNSSSGVKPTGLFGAAPKPNQSGQPNGLFGSNNTATSNNIMGQGSLFGVQSQGIGSQSNTNPYNYNNSFGNIKQDVSTMPQSITENLFSNSSRMESTNRKRVFSDTTNSNSRATNGNSTAKLSLLSRLGQTIKSFRSSKNAPTPLPETSAEMKGIFTPSNYVNFKNVKGGANHLRSSSLGTKSSNALHLQKGNTTGNHSDVKRLVIKSKPLKFHLIDTDKVFNTKRRRILVENSTAKVISSDKILNGGFESDEEIESEDDLMEGKSKLESLSSRFPYRKHNSERRLSETVDGSNIVEDKVNLDDKDLNDGYWCSPSIKELSGYSIDQLSEVDNFIIGKVGFGQISYGYPVDLSGVSVSCKDNGTTLNKELFGNLVQFKKGCVLVYHGDANKPPIGFGLNVPATITMENMFPKSSETSIEFIKRLQMQKGMDFVTYDPITGYWVFKVMHFSIWGLIDDDEELSPDLVSIKRKQDELEAEARLESSKIYETDEYREELKRQRVTSFTKGVPGGWGSTEKTQPNAALIKRMTVANEIQNQLELFREEQTNNVLNHHDGDITVDSDRSSRSDSPASLVFSCPVEDTYGYKEKSEPKFKYLKQLVSVLPNNILMDDLVDEKAYEAEISNEAIFDNIQVRPNIAISDDWLVQLELANDLNSSLNPLTGDTSESKHLSVDMMDNMLFSGVDLSMGKTTSDRIMPEHSDSTQKSLEPSSIGESKIINTLLTKTDVSTRSVNGYPQLPRKLNVTFKDLLIEEYQPEEEVHIIKLCSALFDKHDVSLEGVESKDIKLINHLTGLNRREIFSEWLRAYNVNTIEKLTKSSQNDPLDLIYIQICAGDLKSAIELALNSNNNHLAVLLTLLDANDSGVRTVASSQLQYWQEFSSSSFIPNTVTKIYQILSGDFDEILSDLPWNIAFALKYFYGDYSQDLGNLIQEFKNKLKPSGVIFETLELYQNIETIGLSKALSGINSTHLSICLKWFITIILGGDIDIPLDTEDTLTHLYGKYLTNLGLWKKAIFVYSRLENDKDNETAIRKLIFDNITDININDVEEEKFFTNSLRVPHSLIYEAVASNEGKQGNHWAQCEALLVANLWEEVHECIVSNLGPSTVITNNAVLKTQLLDIVSRIPSHGLIIPQWSQGAGIYVQYVQLVNSFGENSEFSVVRSPEFKKTLDSLLSNIPLMIPLSLSSFQNKVALKIISKRVGDWALVSSGELKDKIKSLPLGENERQYFDIRLATA